MLAAITKDVLSILGESTVKALVLELNQWGISMKPEEFDIIKVDQGLRKIFGSATEIFMKQIYHEFKTKLTKDDLDFKEISEDMPVAEKIAQLLVMKAPG